MRWLLRRIIWAKQNIDADNWKQFVEAIGSGKHKFLKPENPLVIEANLGKLGLLPKEICTDVVKIYKDFNGLGDYVDKVFDNPKGTDTAVDILYQAYLKTVEMIDSLNERMADFAQVAKFQSSSEIYSEYNLEKEETTKDLLSRFGQ